MESGAAVFWRRHSFAWLSVTWLEPCRFLVAIPVGGEHKKIRLVRAIQVQHSMPVSRDGTKVPAGGVDAHDLTGGLECARLGQVTFPIRPTAKAEEAAVGRPIDMINLIGPIFDVQGPLTDHRMVRFQVDRGGGDFVVTGAPGNLLSVRT